MSDSNPQGVAQDSLTSGTQVSQQTNAPPAPSAEQPHAVIEDHQEHSRDTANDDVLMDSDLEDDDIEPDDSQDMRTEKDLRRQAKADHQHCFSTIEDDHQLYVDIIATTLIEGDHKGKTLYDIFQLKEMRNVIEFKEKYKAHQNAINEAVREQQQRDGSSRLVFLQHEELWGDEEWLATRDWLTPADKEVVRAGNHKNVVGAVAKIAQCFLPLYREKHYRHPVAAGEGAGRDVLRDPSGIPTLSYIQKLSDEFKGFRDLSEGENRLNRVFWSDRPVGLTDEQWCQKMKDLHASRQVELRAEQDKAIEALPTQEERDRALDSRETQRREDDNREREIREGTQNLEARFHVLRQNRTEIQPRLTTVPLDVRLQHREMIPYMKHWWEHNENNLDTIRFTRANEMIRRATNDPTFLLTYTELLQAIKGFRQSLSRSEDAASELQSSGHPPGRGVDLMGDAISLINLFRKSGLDWKAVVSKDIHDRFMRVIYNSNSNNINQARQQFELAWLEPYGEQLHALETAKFAAMTFKMITEHATMPLEEALRVVIEQYQTVNDTLKPANDLLGLSASDHSVPVGELQAALRNRDSGEVQKQCLAAFQYKMELLQLPGHDIIKQVIQQNLSEPQMLEARKQLLGLMPTIFPGDIAAHSLYPIMSSASFVSRYSSCSEQCTEMWGGTSTGRRFFINRYGPSESPIHRIERQAVAGHSWKPFDFPLSSKVGNEDNKLGHVKKYGAEHILGITGVAFSEDIDMSAYPSPIEFLNPIFHEVGSETYRGPYKTTYVLIKWDRFLISKTITDPSLLENYPFEYRWETRSDLRRRWHGPTDQKIYEFARERQAEFEAWQSGHPASERNVSPPRDGRMASLAASYRTTPSSQSSAASNRATPSPSTDILPAGTSPQQSGFTQRNGVLNNRVRFERSDSAYASRSGSQESDFIEQDVVPSVEDSVQIEETWHRLRQKCPNDPAKQRDTMVLLFGDGWRDTMLRSIAL